LQSNALIESIRKMVINDRYTPGFLRLMKVKIASEMNFCNSWWFDRKYFRWMGNCIRKKPNRYHRM